MAKVSDEARKKYFERIGAYKKSATEILEKEERIEAIIDGGDPGAEYKRIVLAHLVGVALDVSVEADAGRADRPSRVIKIGGGPRNPFRLNTARVIWGIVKSEVAGL